VTGRIADGVNARLGGRVGTIRGEREGTIQSDQASFGIAEAAVHLSTTRTTVGVGYRTVSQQLTRGGAVLRNDLSAVDVSLAQTIPLPILRSLDSEWRALLNLEMGRRRQGEDVERANRRLAGVWPFPSDLRLQSVGTQSKRPVQGSPSRRLHR